MYVFVVFVMYVHMGVGCTFVSMWMPEAGSGVFLLSLIS